MATSRTRTLVTVVALGVAVFAACTDSADETSSPGTPAAAPVAVDGALPGFEPNASVVRIVDGDTIVADISGQDERVRLIGIDTPESVIPDTPPECFGPEASDHLETLIPPGTDILIERDAEARDRFDRLLGYVYRSSDGAFVNLQMATDGFAYPLSIEPNDTHADAISDAVALARRDDRGLWAAC